MIVIFNILHITKNPHANNTHWRRDQLGYAQSEFNGQYHMNEWYTLNQWCLPISVTASIVRVSGNRAYTMVVTSTSTIKQSRTPVEWSLELIQHIPNLRFSWNTSEYGIQWRRRKFINIFVYLLYYKLQQYNVYIFHAKIHRVFFSKSKRMYIYPNDRICSKIRPRFGLIHATMSFSNLQLNLSLFPKDQHGPHVGMILELGQI